MPEKLPPSLISLKYIQLEDLNKNEDDLELPECAEVEILQDTEDENENFE